MRTLAILMLLAAQPKTWGLAIANVGKEAPCTWWFSQPAATICNRFCVVMDNGPARGVKLSAALMSEGPCDEACRRETLGIPSGFREVPCSVPQS